MPHDPVKLSRVLVAHSEPDELAGLVESRFPDLTVSYADTPERLRTRLAEDEPQAVFSIKHLDFPGEMHRDAVLAPSVRWVQVGGSGYEHLGKWDPARVTVTNCAGVLAPYLAETVIGAMIALNGSFPHYLARQKAHDWAPRTFRPLSEQTLLVVGLGAIGGEVAKRAKALGMTVVGMRRTAVESPNVDRCLALDRLPEAIADADFVSLHLRHTAATDHLIDARILGAMKPGATLINTARGKIVDEAALIAALGSGQLGGAYLDVFETEPLPPESPLWDFDNVLITPHASDNVEAWAVKFGQFFADNLARWQAGEDLANVVQPG